MGLSGFVSPFLTQAANARGAFKTGEQEGRDKRFKEELSALATKRAAEQDALKAALTRSEIGKNNRIPVVRDPTKDHAANRDYDLAHPLPTNAAAEPIVPVMQNGKPVYTPRSQAIGGEAPRSEPSPQIIAGTPAPGEPTKFFRVPKDHGPAEEIEGINPQAPGAGGGMGAAGIKKAIATNTEKLSIIDDALKELDKHESAVGLTRGLPVVGEYADQRIDPLGNDARAQIANIGSLIIHDRSGAAVTVHEMPRLAPFVPKVSDTPKKIRDNLKKLRAAIEVETGALQQSPAPLQNGGRGSSGKSVSAEDAAHAARDPKFAEWLRSKGYAVP